MPPTYAHTFGFDPAAWEPLFSPECPALTGEHCEKCDALERMHGHLNKVAWWAAKFAESMFPPGSTEAGNAREWGYLAGLWHDLGKFAPDWQKYLSAKMDPHREEISGKLDHATAGAQHAVKRHLPGHLLAYVIAGHHSGLLDGETNGACQRKRLGKTDLPDYTGAPEAVTSRSVPSLPRFLPPEGWAISHFTRMLFSCLVDADFLATETFMNPLQAGKRMHAPPDALPQIAGLVEAKNNGFGTPAPGDVVNIQRRRVVDDCRAAAARTPGLFTLTVPTGGGKTLSSLLFALRHALAHGMRRVIYVVPFTSIIEQNAEVIREIVAPLQTAEFTPLIEHHSALSPEKETEQSRLAAENWDAPIVITTAVQFYESLFAARTSRCRKLHRIANAVIILDEAQALPVDFLAPCLRVLQELTTHYHTSVVLCTATQPAVRRQAEFPIGLEGCREIMQDAAALFTALKRVEVKLLGRLSDAVLAKRLAEAPQVLCIVNRRRHAQELFRLLPAGEGNFHLSALMCPEHRSRVLAKVRARLQAGRPVRLISTQLIEAGVDVDFPVVYRALAGLDSIAQAAGRCNRHGHLPGPGTTYVFEPEDQGGETYFRETAQVTRQLLEIYPDLLSEKAIYHYFDLYYYQQKRRWDTKSIVAKDSFLLNINTREFPFGFQFSTVAEKFRLIEDYQVPVLIPYDEKARKLLKDLRNPAIPLHRELLRGLQRYTVQIPPRLREANRHAFEIAREGEFHVLISSDINYTEALGLTFAEEDARDKYVC